MRTGCDNKTQVGTGGGDGKLSFFNEAGAVIGAARVSVIALISASAKPKGRGYAHALLCGRWVRFFAQPLQPVPHQLFQSAG
jgi:hypothetical protein